MDMIVVGGDKLRIGDSPSAAVPYGPTRSPSVQLWEMCIYVEKITRTKINIHTRIMHVPATRRSFFALLFLWWCSFSCMEKRRREEFLWKNARTGSLPPLCMPTSSSRYNPGEWLRANCCIKEIEPKNL